MVVIGSLNADLVTTVRRLPGAGETVIGTSLVLAAGGKGANQAVAAGRAGAHVRLVGCIGDDRRGEELRTFLASEDLDLDYLREVAAPTGTAFVTVDAAGGNTIVVVPGANAELTADHVLAALADVGPADVVAAQLEVPVDAVRAGFEAARRAGATTVLNASPVTSRTAELLDHASVVVVNESEAAALERGPTADCTVIVTLGARGAQIRSPGGTVNVAPRPATTRDPTGAGDCFLGVLAAGLAQGDGLEQSARAGAVAASLQVERSGAASAMPTAAEITAASDR